MKRIFYIYLLAILTSLSSCKNQDWSFDDYGTTTIYFAYQNPVRRLVLGNDEVFDNTLDNQHKCKIMATLGGVYENKTDRIMDFTVDNSLCNNLKFEMGIRLWQCLKTITPCHQTSLLYRKEVISVVWKFN